MDSTGNGNGTAMAPVPAKDLTALALLPFTLALREPSKHDGPVEFEHQLEIDGRRQRVAVKLVPGQGGVLPVHGDQLVYLSLVQLALRQGNPGETLEFKRGAVFDLLEWSRAGRYYQKFEEALTRLTEMTVHLRSALIRRDGQEYDREVDVSHIINRFHIGKGRDAACMIRWGDITVAAFEAEDFKRLDWSLLLALGKSPLAAQAYRLLDRIALNGCERWEVDWSALASALGMRAEGYARPAQLKQKLQPHCDTLVEYGVIDGVEYERGGKFTFHIRNYLRAQIRRVLIEVFGMYEKLAAQLVGGYDEARVMKQCDCLHHGLRGKPQTPSGYLKKAIEEDYELRYAADEPQAFCGLWGMLGDEERNLYHQAGMQVCGVGYSLFDSSDDPTAWCQELRSVVRFMVAHSLEPKEILRTPIALRATGVMAGWRVGEEA